MHRYIRQQLEELKHKLLG